MQSAFCLMRKPADARGLQHQRGRGVDPCLQLAVEHIQPLAVTAEQLILVMRSAAFFSSSPCSLMNQSSICMARKSLASYAAA